MSDAAAAPAPAEQENKEVVEEKAEEAKATKRPAEVSRDANKREYTWREGRCGEELGGLAGPGIGSGHPQYRCQDPVR